jgi:hypothetical protein
VLRPYSGELILLDRKDESAEVAPGSDDEAPDADESQAEVEAPTKAKKRAGQKQ